MKKSLICLLLLMVLGVAGCKSTPLLPEAFIADNADATRAAIRTEIQDPARRTAMLDVVDEFDADIKAIAKEAQVVREKISAAEADYDTTRAQLQGLYDELGVPLGQLCDTAKEHSLALRQQCSEAEWKSIIADQSKRTKLNIS